MVYFFTNFFREECAIQPEVWADPLRDVQRVPPRDWCPRCRSELYSGERGLCPACLAELERGRTQQEEENRHTNDLTGIIGRIPRQCRRPAGAGAAPGAPAERGGWDGRRLLEGRIRLLRAMGREARELAVLCERYYERGYCRNGKYTL